MKYFYLAITLFFFNVAKCNTIYFEGFVGKSKIYLGLDEYYNGILNGIFFYENSLKNILISGSKKENIYIMTYGDTYDLSKYIEKFEFIKSNDKIEGIWKNNKGLHFNFKLNRINIPYNSTNPLNPKIEDMLDFIKIQHIKLTYDSVINYKNKNFHLVKEKHSNISFFRLGNNFPENSRDSVNKTLEKIHIKMALKELRCTKTYLRVDEKNVKSSFKITYLDTNLIGYSVDWSSRCDLYKPDNYKESLLIDLNNGTPYELDDIISFDKSVTTEKSDGIYKFIKYREQYFAPEIYQIVNKKYNLSQDKFNECNYNFIANWSIVEWVYSEKGIEIVSSYFKNNCGETFLLDFESLKKYKNPKFKYNLN